MVLSPIPLLFPFVETGTAFPTFWRVMVASVATITCFVSALTLFRRPLFGKIMGFVAVGGTYTAALPYLVTNPFAALAGTVILISACLSLIDFKITLSQTKSNHLERSLQRAWFGLLVTPIIVVLSMMFGLYDSGLTVYATVLTSIISQALFIHWSFARKARWLFLLPSTGFLTLILAIYFSSTYLIPSLVFLISLIHLIALPCNRFDLKQPSWGIILNHPARILLATFLGLCVFGTLLLILPVSTKSGAIGIVDAAFTSVSAVCVTGLIVLDTPNAFSMFGQFSILLLIQLGGLGIMSITTVALHAMGHRLSLKHERLLTSMTDTHHRDLIHSLSTILKFTFVAEGIGVCLLTILFCLDGDVFADALWRGLFTSISAFCNAGFALQSDSLVSYQKNPYILNVVAILIVFGGIAPATSLIVPKWLIGKPVSISSRIALVTNVLLLFSGTIFITSFEWNGALAELSLGDKIQNAWFQSVSLRTAGFNSVDIAKAASPSFLVMVLLMFIGGSPGGTAGGVKTTTIGILAMTFWANITNRNDVIIQNRRIGSNTIYRSVTIIVSVMIFWFLVVLMLEATQQISARNIIFEATSAIGTVGLSTGATVFLDEIGKIIIIIAMFGGRIGPMTLFMLLSDEQPKSASRCPIAKISLT